MNHKYALTIFSILILITVSAGCVESSDNLDTGGSDETLRIGAFNIQIFGVSKASKPEVMDILADIIRTYDVIAIQEIRDASQTALPALVDLINADGSQYSYVVSERLGRIPARNNMLISSTHRPYNSLLHP